MSGSCLLQPPDDTNRLALYRFRSGLFHILPPQLRDQLSRADKRRLLLRVLRGYAVYYLTDDRHVAGYCFIKRNYLHKYAFMRLGDTLINPYYVCPDDRGQRLSGRMLRAAIADHVTDGRTLWAVVKQENIPSIRILQGLNFTHAGFSAKGLWSHRLTNRKTKLLVFCLGPAQIQENPHDLQN